MVDSSYWPSYEKKNIDDICCTFFFPKIFGLSNCFPCLQLYIAIFFNSVDEMQALGMESGAITDSQITASSEWNSQHGPERARLHTKETSTGTGAWASLTNDLNQWLQVDLNKITPVTHVATQGRNSRSPVQMVTMYKLQFSDDGASFLFYKRQGESSDAVNSNRIRRYSIFFGARRMIPVRRIIRLKKSGSFLCTRAH